MFGCVLGDMHTGATGQVAATVHLEQFPAPFPYSPLSPFLSLASCFISSAAVFQGPRHPYQGGDDLYPGVDLWPFSMLLSPLLRLPHLLRDQVYFRLILPGPQHLCLINSVHCCPIQPTHARTHMRSHTHAHTHTCTHTHPHTHFAFLLRSGLVPRRPGPAGELLLQGIPTGSAPAPQHRLPRPSVGGGGAGAGSPLSPLQAELLPPLLEHLLLPPQPPHPALSYEPALLQPYLLHQVSSRHWPPPSPNPHADICSYPNLWFPTVWLPRWLPGLRERPRHGQC